MDGRSASRMTNTLNVTKSYKRYEVVKSHVNLGPENTRYIKGEIYPERVKVSKSFNDLTLTTHDSFVRRI